MDGLRWLLLLFGLIVVIGVYFYSRFQRTQSEKTTAEATQDQRVEPSLEGTTVSVQLPIGDSESTEADEQLTRQGQPDGRQQKIVTLRVIAGTNATFPGDKLALSLRGIGMRHGKFGIFHRYDGNDESKVVFSAASLVEPGSFDLTNLKDQEIPGISLFMVLPGPLEAAEAFDLMMVAARALTQALGAELLDESGSTLSIQRERYMREEVIQFEHSGLVA